MKILKYLVILIAIFAICSCSFSNSKKPSILIIALESLSFNDLNCFDDKLPSIKEFCSESVRFTHAFAPSPLSQASLTTLLFGKLPSEHRIIHNGNLFISATNNSLAESAIKKDFNTSLYTGGLNIWRKSGLAQGFEIFNDIIVPSDKKIYRDALLNTKLFNRWINRNSNNSFFSVLYLPDLELNKSKTKNPSLVIDDALKKIKINLKRNNIWNKTHIFIIGLNGNNKNFKHTDSKGLNLYSENSMVSLLIKPPTKKRDLALNWTVDNNVDFVTIYESIFEYLKNDNADNNFIIDYITRESSHNKPILIESAWPQWRQIASSRFSLRNDKFYTLYDKKIKIYNSFSDRDELFPFSKNDTLYKKHKSISDKYFIKKNMLPFNYSYSPLLDKIQVADLILNSKNTNRVLSELNQLSKKIFWDSNFLLWEIKYILNKKNWPLLFEKSSQSDFKAAQYVSSLHLSDTTVTLRFPCKQLFISKAKTVNHKACADKLLKKAFLWVNTTDYKKKSIYYLNFIRHYKRKKINERVELLNYSNGLTWDTRLTPGQETLLTDLFLYMPKNKKYLNILAKQPIATSF